MRLERIVSRSIIMLTAMVLVVSIPTVAVTGSTVIVDDDPTLVGILDPGTKIGMQIAALFAAVAGGVVRTYIPYLRKKQAFEEQYETIRAKSETERTAEEKRLMSLEKDGTLRFRNRFLYTFGIAVITSVAFVMTIAGTVISAAEASSSAVLAIAAAFTITYTANDVLNEMGATH
jgi:hypothetical protein